MDTSRKGMLCLIFGILSLVFMFIPVPVLSWVGIVLAIVGLVFGNQVKKVDPSNGMAKAGRILCLIGLILCIIGIVIAAVAVGMFMSALS